ncbi:MAG TPA: PrgI family protein [Thermomicrobiaceae bacterium]|nr:PrgI family protein [Thermomicrobiaceae bacterium]
MDDPRHQIPTHLNVEDKAFYGLTARQVMILIAGASSGYSLWNQSTALPMALRAGLAAVCLVLASAIALIHPQGRGLEEWAFVGLHYAALPKASVWRPRAFSLDESPNADVGWVALAPQPRWELAR